MSLQQSLQGSNSQQAGRDIFNIQTPEVFSTRITSHISDVVYSLNQQIELELDPPRLDKEAYGIADKIRYNNLIKYEELILEYGSYGSIIDSVYSALDSEKPNTTRRFLTFIHNKYLMAVGELKRQNPETNRQALISANADSIIERVLESLRKTYLENLNSKNVTAEDLDTCLLVIICKAFIECKVLEAPI